MAAIRLSGSAKASSDACEETESVEGVLHSDGTVSSRCWSDGNTSSIEDTGVAKDVELCRGSDCDALDALTRGSSSPVKSCDGCFCVEVTNKKSDYLDINARIDYMTFSLMYGNVVPSYTCVTFVKSHIVTTHAKVIRLTLFHV